MNKPRQYRGITKERKWVKGWYCKIEGKSYIIPDDSKMVQVDYTFVLGVVGFVEVFPESVGQSTGLKDKNNVEEYFDDIVRWNDQHWVIIWSETLAGIQLQPLANYITRQKDMKVKRLFGPSFGIGVAKYSECVGTAYDSLFKGED